MGVIGWHIGGGFGFFSKMFGTGAANMLEATVVTSQGEVVTASEFQNPDLFYALRGGGYGFGVVISLTVRTHPLPAVIGHFYMRIRSKSRLGMEELSARFLHLYRDTVLGPMWGRQVDIRKVSTITDEYRFAVSMLTLLTYSEMVETWLPLLSWAQANPDEYSVESLSARDFPGQTFWDISRDSPNQKPTPYDPKEPNRAFAWNGNLGEISSYWMAYASRWLQNDQFLKDPTAGAKILLDLAEGAGYAQLHLSKAQNGAPQWAIDELDKTPMHPSIKNSFGLWIGDYRVDHFSPLVSNMAQYNTSGVRGWLMSCKTDSVDDCDMSAFYQAVNQFREVTPGSGAYFNEADYNEPDWQNTFWGKDNYRRLLDIKNRWDPEELFYCHNCVGSETWQEGGMCKKS